MRRSVKFKCLPMFIFLQKRILRDGWWLTAHTNWSEIRWVHYRSSLSALEHWSFGALKLLNPYFNAPRLHLMMKPFDEVPFGSSNEVLEHWNLNEFGPWQRGQLGSPRDVPETSLGLRHWLSFDFSRPTLAMRGWYVSNMFGFLIWGGTPSKSLDDLSRSSILDHLWVD